MTIRFIRPSTCVNTLNVEHIRSTQGTQMALKFPIWLRLGWDQIHNMSLKHGRFSTATLRSSCDVEGTGRLFEMCLLFLLNIQKVSS